MSCLCNPPIRTSPSCHWKTICDKNEATLASKERRAHHQVETTAENEHLSRGLNGTMSWLVAQNFVRSGAHGDPNRRCRKVEDVNEVNKTLWFWKANAEVVLDVVRLGEIQELVIGTHTVIVKIVL